MREIDAARGESERLSRADRLRLRRVSDDLRQAATRTEEVASAIAAERALIFAHVFREIRQDLDRVARDLDDEGGNQTGLRTQAVLENAIETTQWALGALKDEQKRREDEERQRRQQQQQQQEQQGQNQEALVPDSAELKLLRQLEVDTLEGLDRLRLVYPELESDGRARSARGRPAARRTPRAHVAAVRAVPRAARHAAAARQGRRAQAVSPATRTPHRQHGDLR